MTKTRDEINSFQNNSFCSSPSRFGRFFSENLLCVQCSTDTWRESGSYHYLGLKLIPSHKALSAHPTGTMVYPKGSFTLTDVTGFPPSNHSLSR